MKKRIVSLLVLTFIFCLLGNSALATTTVKPREDGNCWSSYALVDDQNYQYATAKITNDDQKLRVEVYTREWAEFLYLEVSMAAANSVSELPSKSNAITKFFPTGTTLAYTEEFINYDKSVSNVVLVIEAVIRDTQGNTHHIWAQGTPLIGTDWKEYIEYNIRPAFVNGEACYVPEEETPEEPSTSPRTIGYWQTHAGFHGNNEDVITQYLPIILGTREIKTASDAVNVFKFKTFAGGASNGYNKLEAQLLAAKLNGKNGANISSISNVMIQADALLSLQSSKPWSSLTSTEQQNILNVKDLLDQYNNSGTE